MSIRRRRARPLLGTFVEISVVAAEVESADAAISAAFDEVERIQNLMSFHDPESELSRLNSTGRLKVSEDTRRVMEFSQEMYQRTQGAFNVAVAPALIRHGYLPNNSPSSYSVGTALDYSIEGDEITYRKPIGVDLGGVAKGYAVDCAVEVLRALEIHTAIVIAGGDLRAYGELRDYYLRNPANPSLLESFMAGEDLAIATSAGYFCNPETHGDVVPYVDGFHQCLKEIPSVTVVAPRCVIADALTKYVLLKKPSVEQLSEFSAKSVVREHEI